LSFQFFVSQQADSLAIPPGIPFMNTIVYGYMDSQGDTTAVKRKRYKIYVPDLKTDQVSILPDKSKIIVTLAQYVQSGVGLTKLAPNDSLLWERSIRYVVVDTGSASSGIRQFTYAPNRDLYLASSIVLSGPLWDSTGSYAWLVKLDSFGCLVPGCHLGDSIFRPDTPVSLPIVQYANQMEWLVYPNPTADILKIELKAEFLPAGLKAGILSLDGKLLQEVDMEPGQVELDLSSIPQGIYLCRLRSKDGIISYRKIVKN
jgi:hypothetical protein